MRLNADLLAHLELAILATECYVREVCRIARWRSQIPVFVPLQVLERKRITLPLIEAQECMQAGNFERSRELPLGCAEHELVIGRKLSHEILGRCEPRGNCRR